MVGIASRPFIWSWNLRYFLLHACTLVSWPYFVKYLRSTQVDKASSSVFVLAIYEKPTKPVFEVTMKLSSLSAQIIFLIPFSHLSLSLSLSLSVLLLSLNFLPYACLTLHVNLIWRWRKLAINNTWWHNSSFLHISQTLSFLSKLPSRRVTWFPGFIRSLPDLSLSSLQASSKYRI